jgi:hypothetical protein
MQRQLLALLFAIVPAGTAAVTADAGTFLVSERNASSIWEWESTGGGTALFHSVQCNDVDLNPGEGSTFGWIAEHFTDHIGRFVPGSVNGLDQQYGVSYAYPKHITVYNSEIIVMSRNNAQIERYDGNGVAQGSVPTGNGTGQGMATDGTDLYASFWNGQSSFFERYDSNFASQGTINNPTGMGALTNIVDFAYDGATGHFFGLAADFEQGTLTETNIVLEFEMGGAVIARYTLPFLADGMGQRGGPAPTAVEPATWGGIKGLYK